MKTTQTLPPYIQVSDRVILFDGVCKLCNAWSNFIIYNDGDKIFKLASVQSQEGQAILRHFGFPTDFFETMLLVEGAQCFEKSEAFFRVMKQLHYPWKAVTLFRIMPAPIRDWLYDRIALNRYQLFGKYQTCRLPTPDHEARYLDGG